MNAQQTEILEAAAAQLRTRDLKVTTPRLRAPAQADAYLPIGMGKHTPTMQSRSNRT